MTVLAADAGRTSFRAAVFADGTRRASVKLDSGATLADDGGAARLLRLLDAAIRALGDAAIGELERLVVAAAGAIFRPAQAERLADALAKAGYADQEVVVTTDIVAAHSGALDGRSGVVLAAGTGAVAFGVSGSGNTALVDGAGYLIGDAGSGFAVGRAGLAAAMRHHDGRPGGSKRLARLAVDQFGPLAELPGRLHGDSAPAREVASFAPAVAQAARDGDPTAAAIWRDAVAELADTAMAACRALGDQERRVALTGSLFDLADLVTGPLSVTLAARQPGVVVRRATADAVVGAARLATRPAGVYENLLFRRPSSPPPATAEQHAPETRRWVERHADE
ncbi:MAG TPA: BadF/BadG/BcrA/BcrD ATPase family protein [Jiangellales bacterium]|nr:BadF/BadG/BcrA/BcrD ATPase family protein [Jiangellales bacterium]